MCLSQLCGLTKVTPKLDCPDYILYRLTRDLCSVLLRSQEPVGSRFLSVSHRASLIGYLPTPGGGAKPTGFRESLNQFVEF